MKHLQYLPEGVRDWSGKDLEIKNDLIERLNKVYKSHGYEPVETPLLEYYEVFQEERGSIEPQGMMKVIDRQGNILVLRPDLTPAISRLIGSKAAGIFPDKVYSINHTYKFLREYGEGQCEMTQSTVELIGESSIIADAQMLMMSVESLLQMGLTDFRIDIGDVNYFKGITERIGLSRDESQTLEKMIESKNDQDIKDFLTQKGVDGIERAQLEKLPSLFGDESILNMEHIELNGKSQKALERLIMLSHLIQELGIKQYIGFDLSMICRLNYYTDTIFRGYTYGSGGPILYGGRYDGLSGKFGPKRPAVGFGIMIDEVMNSLSQCEVRVEKKRKLIRYVVHDEECFIEAWKYSKDLRESETNRLSEVRLIKKQCTNEKYISMCKQLYVDHLTFISKERGIITIDLKEMKEVRGEVSEEVNDSISQRKVSQRDTETLWESRH